MSGSPASDHLRDGLGADELDGAFGLVVDGLGGLPADDVVARCQRYRDRLDAVEAVRLADMVTADGDTRAASRAAAGRAGKTSKREARRRGRRAAAVAKNKFLADKMATGDLSGEQVDAIAHASAKSDGAAAVDDDLIDKIATAGADQGRKIADDWLADRADPGDTQSEHDRQRRLRRASRYTNRDGLGVINLEGDQVTIDAIWADIITEASRLYLADGGRDIAVGEHARTNAQRRFDAASHLMLGDVVGGATTASSTRPNKNRKSPTVVVTVDLAKLTGDAPHAVASQLGVGPIADSVLANYLPNCDLVGAIFSTDGQPLWLGRTVRHATAAQRLALAIRDKGCVQCTADWRACHAHHLTPWHAPARGETDIDKLVLLCPSCHHSLHTANQTLYKDPSGHWKNRPATPAETPQRE